MSNSLKELKKNRLTPAEKWVLETIEGVEPEIKTNDYVVWSKDGKRVFTQYFKNGDLVVSLLIWLDLKKEFGFSYGEIEELINNVMYDYTNNGKLKVC